MKYLKFIKIGIIVLSILISFIVFIFARYYVVEFYDEERIIKSETSLSVSEDIKVKDYIESLEAKTSGLSISEDEFGNTELFSD